MALLVNLSRLLGFRVLTSAKHLGSEFLPKQAPLVPTFWDQQIRKYRKLRNVPTSLPWANKYPEYQSEVIDPTEEEEKQAVEVCAEINRQITEDKTGRLFAVIHLAGKQYKVTESDLIVVRGYWPPNPGDKVTLEKVLLLGSKDFTLLGRPILNRELVSIDATVIDKTFSHTVTHFRFRKRKQYRRIHFDRFQQTMLRINTIKINGKVDQKLEFEGLDRIY
ncbi:39S ribosomal protein L21, mitochondrial [Copidosoma floridanum]|uniref:39S ribosomal protein L21, mitochondrial n=1 Tax=Copidosoma floridanum TaxID=29053 RepID=UPI0006C998D6|nr:39S ribosomal protein L21, mitochondrial [Copidosoma floridanum]